MNSIDLKKINQFETIMLYGIGNQFKECYKIFEGKKVIFFDRDPLKWGTMRNGICIHSPEEILELWNEKAAVVISGLNNQYEIAKFLIEEKRIPEKFVFMYTSPWYEEKVYKPNKIIENWARIEKICEHLADDESKEYYKNSIKARIFRNPYLLAPNVQCKITGEYGTQIMLEEGECIFDCGAYTGDTAAMYMERLNSQCEIFAIEPFKESYDQLCQRVLKEHWEDCVHPYNCALGGALYSTSINYNENDFGMAMNILNKDGDKTQNISVETLDHLLENKDVTYIKMDIEGEECEALEGAQTIIRKRTPKLMISAYHKIEDFWEIPETIWNIYDNYDIYVGHAPGVSTEMEFYCVDRMKSRE